jgi:energy-coupling factor transporter ATP-binding protein EcfA2
MTLDKIFHWFRDVYGWQDIIPVHLQPGHSRLLVITGENATGKSLLRRILQQLARQDEVEAIAISPEYRQMGGIARAFVYGDETNQASGQIACHVVTTAIRTSQGREKPHVIILDEPDMGLSDNASAGVAQAIVNYCNEPSPYLGYFAVITHRKAMLSLFAQAEVSHIRVGDELSLAQVVEQPIVPIAPEVLQERAYEMFQRVKSVLNEKRLYSGS